MKVQLVMYTVALDMAIAARFDDPVKVEFERFVIVGDVENEIPYIEPVVAFT